jgi:hypothetical protein
MATNEELYEQQLNQDRAWQVQKINEDRAWQVQKINEDRAWQVQKINEDRAMQEQLLAWDRQRQATKQAFEAGEHTAAGDNAETVTFPWLMFSLAFLFDLVSLIPIVNIATEIFAALVLWLWKKSYNSKTNPLIDIVAAKIIDYICLDILPSNMFTVVYAYIKKKAASAASSKTGGKIITKLAT